MEFEARVMDLENRISTVENKISDLEQENETLMERVEENSIDISMIIKVLHKKFPQEKV